MKLNFAFVLLASALLSGAAFAAETESVNTCSLPALTCGSTDGSSVDAPGCSITCDGHFAICDKGLVVTGGNPGCRLVSENHCYCSGGDD